MFTELNFEQCIPIALTKIKHKDRSKLYEIKALKGSLCGWESEHMKIWMKIYILIYNYVTRCFIQTNWQLDLFY